MLHKAIKGFENYLVTDTGRVYSLKRRKYLKNKKDKDGYMVVGFRNNTKYVIKKVHRLVAEAFIPNPENKAQVDHINRVRDDNRVQNLRWADMSENSKNRDNNLRIHTQRKIYGTAITEVINEEISVTYLSLGEVPNINKASLFYRINKGETDFTIKQKNGNVRHFKLPPKQKRD